MSKIGGITAILGFSAVGLGAFGAHGLGDLLDEKALGWWETATQYALIHAVGALAICLSPKAAKFQKSALAFLIGALIFSSSLYAMALGAPRFLGAVTPIGGLGFLAGWAMLALGLFKQKS